MRQTKIAALATIILLAPLSQAQEQEAAPEITFGGYDWQVTAVRAELGNHLGRPALALEKGRLWADDAGFSDGVISFKVAYPEHRAFIGVAWRDHNRRDSEEMYFRAHLNEKPDALQYTPVNNQLSAWQIFSDGNAIAPVSQSFSDWNDVRIVVEGDRADVYFNSDEPVLHIPDLKNDLAAGGLVLRSSNREDGTTWFADFSARPLADGEGVVGTPKPAKPLPDGLIESWQVSTPFDEAKVADKTRLVSDMMDGLTWAHAKTETNGIVNLARLSGAEDKADTVLVRKTLSVDTAQIAILKFGFSDRVRIYLNGELLFAGNDGYITRDYRFLGLIGFHDAVGLHLKPGDNQLVVAVSETFGGWGWAGAISYE